MTTLWPLLLAGLVLTVGCWWLRHARTDPRRGEWR